MVRALSLVAAAAFWLLAHALAVRCEAQEDKQPPVEDKQPRVLFPGKSTVVRSPHLMVVGMAPKGAEISWQLEGALRSYQGTTRADLGQVFEIFLLLDAGENQFKVGKDEFAIFLASPGQSVPSAFQDYRAHQGDITWCEDCHEAHDLSNPRDGYPSVCVRCHDIESSNPENPAPVTSGIHFQKAVSKCGSCHDPHAGLGRALLKKPAAYICEDCHSAVYGDKDTKPLHAEQACIVCHDPHYSGYVKDLRDEPRVMCRNCHARRAPQHQGKPHPAVYKKRACLHCHDPHSSKKQLLRSEPRKLCETCHPGVQCTGTKELRFDCVNCHDPHDE